MYEVLIREAAARFGLGDKSLPLLQILLACMTDKQTGGLAGFLEKFKTAELGPTIQSWLGGGPTAKSISNAQLETVLGSEGDVIALISGRLGLERDKVTSALGYLLPVLVGKLTLGGSLPNSLPTEVVNMAESGRDILAAPPVTDVHARSGGGVFKWLPWAVVGLLILLGALYWNSMRTAETAPAPVVEAPAAIEPETTAPAPAVEEPAAAAAIEDAAPVVESAAQSEATADAQDAVAELEDEAAAAEGADTASPSEADAVEDSGQAPTEGAAVGAPTGAAVEAFDVDGLPALKVYFDLGKTEVASDFAAKAENLVAYLRQNAGSTAVLTGFTDPSGDAAANEALAKSRADAVEAALVLHGAPFEQIELEKPADSASKDDAGPVDAATLRRVDVVLRP